MITLNAWSCGFRNEPSSVKDATPRHVRWVFDRETFAGVTIFEDAAMWATGADKVQSTNRIGWLHEPFALHPHYYDEAVAVRHEYDYILTHYQPLIDAYPESFKFTIHGGVSVPPEQWGMHPKSRNVAMLLSDKQMTPNHQLRHRIAAEVKGIDVYRNLYGQAKIDTLKDYRFVVVIENSSEPNWWTEHVLDPIALGCVPVYYYPSEAAKAPHALEKYIDFRTVYAWDEGSDLHGIMQDLEEFGVTAYPAARKSLIPNQSKYLHHGLVTPEDWFAEHALAGMLEPAEVMA